MPDPLETARFRHEQISPFLDERLSRTERRNLLKEKARERVEWPQSKEARKAGKPALKKAISHSTLKRWLALYREHGFVGLLPRPRKDRGHSTDRDAEQLAYALGLLWEEPERSLTQLLAYLALEFPDFSWSRSALHRRLLVHPAYEGIQRLRQGKKSKRGLRDLYETSGPHECWQLDGKGAFTVKLQDGHRLRVHVLTVIDHFSRMVLATVVAPAEDTGAAVRVFRLAAAKYGLPDRLQMDRGSAFESDVFRGGIAQLGTHRNWVEAQSPECQGVVEAYHRVLGRWFIGELKHQEIVDLEHLEALLQATVDVLYNRTHNHRVLKKTPIEVVGNALCSRRVSAAELRRVFRIIQTAVSHAKTGEVVLPNGHFRVPSRYAGSKRTFGYDPVEPEAALLLNDEHEVSLEPFRKKRAFTRERPPAGTGQLQKLLDVWRGRERPNAQAGFGLPEVFRALARLVGYLVPKDDHEAATVQRFYRRHGPLPRDAFTRAIQTTAQALGDKRPLRSYLDHLERLIRADQDSTRKDDTP